jgi:hypothetical protein
MEKQLTKHPDDPQIKTLGAKPLWKSKLLWGFVAISTIIAFVVGGLTLNAN